MHGKKVSIAIPASVVSDVPHLRERTSKIGLIGRVSAIFRVDEIIIYSDRPRINQAADTDLIRTLLSYMDTPQYLRKRLFPIDQKLQYAGILPPLRTPHHPLAHRAKQLKVGEPREAVTLSHAKQGTLLDIGVEYPALYPEKKLPVNKRVTVKITKTGTQIEVEIMNREAIRDYWGYSVIVEKRPFGEMVRSRNFDLAIATSKYGLPFTRVVGKVAERWNLASTVLVGFGSPANGLSEIVAQERLRLKSIVDFVVNTVPEQGTETVRTEEALVATMAILNVSFL